MDEIGSTRRFQPQLSAEGLRLMSERYGVKPWKVRDLRSKYAEVHGLGPARRGRIPRLSAENLIEALILRRLGQMLTTKRISYALGCSPRTLSVALRNVGRGDRSLVALSASVEELITFAGRSGCLRQLQVRLRDATPPIN